MEDEQNNIWETIISLLWNDWLIGGKIVYGYDRSNLDASKKKQQHKTNKNG